MKKLSVLALCGAFALAACATTPAVQYGADGKPLPRVYRIEPDQEAAVTYRVLDGVNALRQARSAPPLQLNAELTAAAATHSRDMSAQNRPWHFGSDGSSPLVRAQRAGYRGKLLGEDIAETYQTETETLANWTQDQNTRAVLLNPAATDLGFAWYQERNGKLWYTVNVGQGGVAAPFMMSSN